MGLENIGAGLQDDGSGNVRTIENVLQVATNQSIVAADHTNFYQATGALTFTLNRANTLFNGFVFKVNALSNPITFIPDANDSYVTQFGSLASGGAFTIPKGTVATFTTNALAAGSWYVEADPGIGSGIWVLLNTLTANNSATLSDTTHITSTYQDYKLVFENVIPANSAVDCMLQVHTNGAFQTTNYQAVSMYASASSASAASSSTFIPCGHKNGATQNNGSGISGEINLYNASSTTSPKIWEGTTSDVNSSPTAWISTVGGAYVGGNTAIDGFQVLFSAGVISSGTIKLYGRL